MTMYWKSASKFAIIGAALVLLGGCGASTALSPGRSVLDVADAKNSAVLGTPQNAAFQPHPSGFEWAGQILQATGQGSAPPGMTGPQVDLMARNSATVHALTNLKEQIKALSVGTDQTVGSIMNSYITVRRAVEQEIASAQVVGSRPLQDAGVEVQVSLSMQNIATILHQYHITPDEELPQTAEVNPAVPDMI